MKIKCHYIKCLIVSMLGIVGTVAPIMASQPSYTLVPVDGEISESAFSVVNYQFDLDSKTWIGQTSNIVFDNPLGDAPSTPGVGEPYYFQWQEIDGKDTLVKVEPGQDFDVYGYTTDNSRYVAAEDTILTGEININKNVFNQVVAEKGAAVSISHQEINFITGDFAGNKATTYPASGGALYITGSNIESIKGNFVGNDGGWEGGAIFIESVYNSSEEFRIGSIEAAFVGNQSDSSGGAITVSNFYSIDIIKANFINNMSEQGSAIFLNQYSYIDEIHGNFIGNSATKHGAAISNIGGGSIGAIYGDFISNTGQQTGALYLGSSKRNGGISVGTIEGDFVANSAMGSGGGAINISVGAINTITGDFIANHAGSSGGAIYSSGASITFLALERNMLFSGNTVGADRTSNAIYSYGYNDDSANTLNFNAYDSFSITVNDGIDGRDEDYLYQIININNGLDGSGNAIFADPTTAKDFGKVYFNSTIVDHTVKVHAGVLVLGSTEATSITVDGIVHDIAGSSAKFTNGKLEIMDGALVIADLAHFGSRALIENAGELRLTGTGEISDIVHGKGAIYFDSGSEARIDRLDPYEGDMYMDDGSRLSVFYRSSASGYNGNTHIDNATLVIESGSTIGNNIYIYGQHSKIETSEGNQLNKAALYIGVDSSVAEMTKGPASLSLKNMYLEGSYGSSRGINIAAGSKLTLIDSTVSVGEYTQVNFTESAGELLLKSCTLDSVRAMDFYARMEYTADDGDIITGATIFTLDIFNYDNVRFEDSLTLNIDLSSYYLENFMSAYNTDKSKIGFIINDYSLNLDYLDLIIIINDVEYTNFGIGELAEYNLGGGYGTRVYHLSDKPEEVLPEPSTASLSLLALTGLLLRRRRKQV